MVVAIRTTKQGIFKIRGLSSSHRGAVIWEEDSDWMYYPHSWVPMYQVVLAGEPGPAQRVYWPVKGGALRFRDNLDVPQALTKGLVSLMSESSYQQLLPVLANIVYVNGLPVAGADGSVYWTTRVFAISLPASLVEAGIQFGQMFRAVPQPDGSHIVQSTNASVLAGAAPTDMSWTRFPNQFAPVFSLDMSTLYYVIAQQAFSGQAFVVGLDAQTLALKIAPSTGQPMRILALDPRSTTLVCHLFEDSSSSPMVGPDGDVYVGIIGNPSKYTGWLLHFDAELQVRKIPGPFGWDNTPSVVPLTMVPWYNGPSPYLVASKMNNYAGIEGGTGEHHFVLLDPNVGVPDTRTIATIMSTVRSVLAPTPDYPILTSFPNARKEWCTNTALVDPFTKTIIMNNEDGICYRWDPALNTLVEHVRLSAGRRQAYTPTAVAPNGLVLAINWAVLNEVGRSYADVNEDNVVDILDVVRVLDRLEQSCTQPCAEDVDGNGKIDSDDISYIMTKWHASCNNGLGAGPQVLIYAAAVPSVAVYRSSSETDFYTPSVQIAQGTLVQVLETGLDDVTGTPFFQIRRCGMPLDPAKPEWVKEDEMAPVSDQPCPVR